MEFDCTSCDISKGFERITDSSTAEGGKLGPAVNVDPKGEKVEIDQEVLEGVTGSSFPQEAVDPVVKTTMTIAAGGMAVFSPPLTQGSDPGIAVPWVVISDLVQSFHGTPPELKSDLGLGSAVTQNDVKNALTGGFAFVPPWLLASGVVERLLKPDSPFVALGLDAQDTPPPRPAGSGQPTQSASAEEIRNAVRGFVRGKWNGLGGHWWGWPFGWQVAISHSTATTIGQLLTGFNGGGKLIDVLRSVLAAESISSGIKALSLTAGLAMALYASALGANILAVRTSKGVRIQGNWPVIGGPGAFVWAIKG